jgi:hypothetical protein
MIPGGGVQPGWLVRHEVGGEEGWVIRLRDWGCEALIEWPDGSRSWEGTGYLTPLR